MVDVWFKQRVVIEFLWKFWQSGRLLPLFDISGKTLCAIVTQFFTMAVLVHAQVEI